MQALELKVPPLVVALVVGLLMWLTARLLPAATFSFDVMTPLAIVVAALAAALGASGIVAFRQHDTTVLPMHPDKASTVVRDGIFRYTRNPMYLGLALLLAAWAIYLANIAALALLVPFVLYMTRFQIIPEERALLEKFGSDYADYAIRTRRWL